MKIEFDKKLLKYAAYISVTAIVIYIAFLVLLNIGTILKTTFNLVMYIFNLLKPLIIGIIIAYLLYPITRFIERLLKNNSIYKVEKASIRRIVGIVFSYLSVIAILLSLIWGIYFMIGGQLSQNTTIVNIINEIILYFENNSFSTQSVNEAIDKLNSPFIDSLKPYITHGFDILGNYISSNLRTMTSSLVSIGSSIVTFFIAFIISIYLLKDSEYFVGLWKKLYYLVFGNSKSGHKITYVFSILHEVFGKFIRGQFLEAVCVGVLSTIALSLTGISYSFVIGIIAGICNMIPYAGPIVGTVLAAIMGLLSGSPIKMLYAVIAMIIVQQIDNHLLAPKIIGDSVGLHAVFTMMAILIGGNIGGLIGMLLAVPIAASCKVLFNNWYNKYQESHSIKEKNKS